MNIAMFLEMDLGGPASASFYHDSGPGFDQLSSPSTASSTGRVTTDNPMSITELGRSCDVNSASSFWDAWQHDRVSRDGSIRATVTSDRILDDGHLKPWPQSNTTMRDVSDHTASHSISTAAIPVLNEDLQWGAFLSPSVLDSTLMGFREELPAESDSPPASSKQPRPIFPLDIQENHSIKSPSSAGSQSDSISPSLLAHSDVPLGPIGIFPTQRSAQDLGATFGFESLACPPFPNLGVGPIRKVGRRGLSGWGDTQNAEVSSESVPCFPVQQKRPRSLSPVPQDLDKIGANERSSLSDYPFGDLSSRKLKRSRKAVDSALYSLSDDEHEEEDDLDSDEYCPSRSPSPVIDHYVSPDPEPFQLSRQSTQSGQTSSSCATSFKRNRGTKGRKVKSRGSAALALAVVAQMGEVKRHSSQSSDAEEFDPVEVYRQGGNDLITKRKNQPIPLPVPIPNLNKKSRGRKVPFVADVQGGESDATSAGRVPLHSSTEAEIKLEDADVYVPKTSRSRRKGKMSLATAAAPSEKGGVKRTYVCAIPGCGKCFVRGEHLKRHVRSIHTHDKPHACPFDGCDKSFSRRDNLGQHVRIHLQS